MKLIAGFLLAASLLGQTAVFPGAAVTNQQLMVAGNNIITELNTAVSATDTTMVLKSVVGIVPNMLISFSDSKEIANVCNVIGSNVVVIGSFGSCPNVNGRGFDSTTATPHAASTAAFKVQVAVFLDAWHHNAMAAEVEAVEAKLIAEGTPLIGADPTGVASSTAAFNTAGAACGSTTKGGSIYIPPGLYKVTNGTLYGNCTYWTSTQGLLSTVLKPGDGTSAVFSSVVRQAGNSVDSVVLDGITFQGFTFATSNSNQGLNLSGAAGIKLKNVTSNNMYRLITCADCLDISIQDLDIWQQGGIWLGSGSGLTQGITLQNINAIVISDWSGTNTEPIVQLAGTASVSIDNLNSLNMTPATKGLLRTTGICEGFSIQNSFYLGGSIGYDINGSAFGQLTNVSGDKAAIGGILLTGTTDVSVTGGTITESSPCKVTDAPCTYQYGVKLTAGNIRPSVHNMNIDGAFGYGMQQGSGIFMEQSGTASVTGNTIHIDSRVGQATGITVSSTEVGPTVTGNTIADPSRYAVVSITQGASTLINMGTNGNLDPTTLTDFLIRTGSVIRLTGGTGALGTALNDGPGHQFTVTAQSANGFTIAANTTSLSGTAPTFTFFSNNAVLDNVPYNSFKFISGNSVNNSFGYDSVLVNKIPYSADVGTADTIYPTGELFKINGNTPTVNTIFAPSGYYGCISTFPVQAFSWGTGGNIQKTGTAVPGIAIRWCFDGAKWWASQ